jgi:hypothetical protein
MGVNVLSDVVVSQSYSELTEGERYVTGQNITAEHSLHLTSVSVLGRDSSRMRMPKEIMA